LHFAVKVAVSKLDCNVILDIALPN